MTAEQTSTRSGHWPSVIFVWLFSVVGAVLAFTVAPAADRLSVLAVVLAGSGLITMIVQLILRQQQGYISRVSLSLVGATIIVAIAAGVAALLGA